jgi:hypothetical protein
VVPYLVPRGKLTMGKTEKLITKARSSPKNFRFDDLCLLAERVGFVFRNQSGSSHRTYSHSIFKEALMNFQPDKGDKSKAKPFQVKQLINFIDDHPSLAEDDDNV